MNWCTTCIYMHRIAPNNKDIVCNRYPEQVTRPISVPACGEYRGVEETPIDNTPVPALLQETAAVAEVSKKITNRRNKLNS